MKFKNFTSPGFLWNVGRPLLKRFFDRFADELAERKTVLPSQELHGDRYFSDLAFVLMSSDALPESLIEVMCAIEEMATVEGMECLDYAVTSASLDLKFDPESSPGDFAMQVWLAEPELFAKQHNRQRMARLSSFEVVAHRCIRTGARIVAPFVLPDSAAMEELTRALDKWFAAHNRGPETTRVETHQVRGEWWFLVRHGDPFVRKAKVNRRRREPLHYRPEKDDVVVFSPEHDELRINARTKGERELYRAKFGKYLRGAEEYFWQHKTLSLDVLHTDGMDALNVRDVDGIKGIVLREVTINGDKKIHEGLSYRADNVFGTKLNPLALIENGRITHAVFDVYLDHRKKARRVEICPPNGLKLARHCDPAAVNRWLLARGFRIAPKGGSYVEDMAVA
jgi:hypothetical protein